MATRFEPSARATYEPGVEAHLPLVKRCLGRTWPLIPPYRREVVAPDDLLQAGIEGLCKAAQRYDASKGYTFATYAWGRVRWHILIAAGLTKHGWEPPTRALAEER